MKYLEEFKVSKIKKIKIQNDIHSFRKFKFQNVHHFHRFSKQMLPYKLSFDRARKLRFTENQTSI